VPQVPHRRLGHFFVGDRGLSPRNRTRNIRKKVARGKNPELSGTQQACGAGAKGGFGGDHRLGLVRLPAGQGEELLREILSGGDAELRLLGEAGANDVVQGGGDGRIRARRRLRSGREDLVAHRGDGIAVKWVETAQHFVQNDTEGKQIGASVLCAAENLFGTPVGGSAADGGIGLMAGQARHAEVRELDAIFRGDKDVGWFDVAMNDRAAVRQGESDGHMSGPFAGSGIGNTALGDHFFERLAFHQFHDQEWNLCGLLDAHVVDSDDRGMRELADDAGFPKEAIARFTASEFRGEKFDGDETVDERIMSADNTATGAGADRFEDLIASDLQGEWSPQCAGADWRKYKGRQGRNGRE
jgi:hypothetical protein